MLIDSHCHLQLLDLKLFGGNLDNLIDALSAHDVKHLLCVAVNLEEHSILVQLAEKYSLVSMSVGLHPNEKIDREPTIEDLCQMANHNKVIAIGETGLDFYRSESNEPWQIDRFKTHIAAAKQLKKPLIIHTRAARKETLQILTEEKAHEIGGVFHCFTEDWNTAKSALDLGFYISFSGIVTFKNALDIQSVAKKVPLDRLLIETDSPYLAPVPFRGKPNQPAYVKQVAEFIANLRSMTYEEVAQSTTENFIRLFQIKI
jgi:TatD DNase family protein